MQTLTNSLGHSIAFCLSRGKPAGTKKRPGVIFIHGLMSDMAGGKALAAEAHCRALGLDFLRLDCTGHGQSGGDFTDGTISIWRDDVLMLLDQVTDGPQILIGSSMGGWLALLAARARPDRVAGLIGIAAAPDFTEKGMWANFSEAQKHQLMNEGHILLPSDYDDPYPITRALIEDGRHNLLLGGPLDIACPVRLLHGMQDNSVPWKTALKVADMLTHEDVEVHLIKGGDHRLSEPHDLARLTRTLDGLLHDLGQSGEP